MPFESDELIGMQTTSAWKVETFVHLDLMFLKKEEGRKKKKKEGKIRMKII